MINRFRFHCLLILVLCFPVLANAKEKVPDRVEGSELVSAEQLIELVDEFDDLVLIDSRKKIDREAGYIEGSIPLPNTETNADTLAKHLPSKSTPVLFYCNGSKCARSVEATRMAVKLGYSKVFWFRGGWEEWTAKGFPVSKD
jgi:rhodanese-related sulfurtransferase